ELFGKFFPTVIGTRYSYFSYNSLGVFNKNTSFLSIILLYYLLCDKINAYIRKRGEIFPSNSYLLSSICRRISSFNNGSGSKNSGDFRILPSSSRYLAYFVPSELVNSLLILAD